MKRLIGIALVLAALLSFAACSSDSKETAKSEKTAKAGEVTAAAAETVDLSNMSGTVVYSEVLNIMQSPEDYIGKNIKMKGFFSKSDASQSPIYYFCVIPDATACCSQGIEFVVDGYEDKDYPENGTNIEVEGTYNSYLENGVTYYHLENAKITEVVE